MKKNLLLLTLFIALGAGAWFATRKNQGKMASTSSWDMDFGVKDISQVQKVFIADRKGGTATLERQSDGSWLYNQKFKARQGAIEILLETIQRINVNYIPPKAAEKTMIDGLVSDGVVVEVYDKAGKRLKRYTVGGVTNDERGTFALMDGAEQPYVVHIPGFVGQLRKRFLLGDDNWRDKHIFTEKPEEVQSVAVEYPSQKFQSFKIEKTGEAQFEVLPFFPETPPSRAPQQKGLAEAYIIQLEKMGAEAFETTNPEKDSVRMTTPFAIVSVKKTNGEEKWVRFYPAEIIQLQNNTKMIHRYYADCNNGDFLLVQDRVFQGLFRGYSYFFGERVRN